tara:strand:- start:8033 stop:10504 length:2472 start_codon:yes stop_codon:yes gene_type:complete
MQEGSGPLDAPLWIVGEAYGKDEEAKSKTLGEPCPFVGAAGRLLRNTLGKVGINQDDVRYENLISERPPKNKFDFFEEEEQIPRLLASVDRLRRRITDSKPNLVLCVGKWPLKYLMGKDGTMSKWRGHIFWEIDLRGKVMATYHPSHCLRTAYGMNAGQAEALFEADLHKAKEAMLSKDLDHFKFKCIINPSFEMAKKELEWIRDHAKIVSYDIECWKGAGYSLMDCIGLAGIRERAVCIPFWTESSSNLQRYWTKPQEEHVIYSLVKEILESETPKVAQNSQFDTVILGTYYNIRVKNLIWDTMVANHSLYCDLPADLGTLISLYTRLPYQKYLISSSKLEDRWEYNCADVIANIHVMEGQLEECKEIKKTFNHDPLPHLRAIPLAAIPMLADMQMTGVAVDEKLRSDALLHELQLQENILEALDDVLPYRITGDKKYSHKTKPNSSADRKHLFLSILGCKPFYGVNKTITFDKHAMEKYQKDKRIGVASLAKWYAKYKESTVISGRLKTPLRERRLHTKYGIGGRAATDDTELGTHTGRLNSKKSDIVVWNQEEEKWEQCGTNLQNISKGLLRRMIVPDVGEEFCLIDLWAAEAYTTALDAGESGMLTMLDSGIKIHQWLKEWIQENHPEAYEETFKENEYEAYHRSKQCVHAANYGVHPAKLSKETGLPSGVCEAILAMYHTKFPGIRLRMERIKREVKETRSLVSLLGRRRVFVAPFSDELLRHAYAWPMQSLIGELNILGTSKIHRTGKPHKIRVALNTHDGAAIRSPNGKREKTTEIVTNAFNIPLRKGDITITVPLEIGWGENFNDITDTEIVRYD